MNSIRLFEMGIRSSLAIPSLCAADYQWQSDRKDTVSVFDSAQLVTASDAIEWSPYLKRLFQEYQQGARFGKFYERLVQVVLETCFGKNSVKSNVQLSHGEIDFLINSGHELIHLEIAVKFYLLAPHLGLDFYGPNKQDSLGAKIKKMTEIQLQRPLDSLQIESMDVKRSIHVPGILFFPWSVSTCNEVVDLAKIPEYVSSKVMKGWWCREGQLKELLVSEHQLYTVPKLLRGLPAGAPLVESADFGINRLESLELLKGGNKEPVFCIRTDKLGRVVDRGFVVDAGW